MEGDPFDVLVYLSRIGFSPESSRALLAAGPTASTLGSITFGHASHIPFENLDRHYPHLRSRSEAARRAGAVVSLEPCDIYHKLVLSPRGGFCFEQNLLLARALREVGFCVTPVASCAVRRTEDALVSTAGYPIGPTTHLALLVAVAAGEGQGRYYVDCGIGRGGMPRSPLPLVAGLVKHEASTGECYRLVPSDPSAHPQPGLPLWGPHRFRTGPLEGRSGGARKGWFLQYKNKPCSEWWDLHQFYEDAVMSATDGELGAWFASTSPTHPHAHTKAASLLTPTGRYSVMNEVFTIRTGEEVREVKIESEEHFRIILEKYFGIKVSLCPSKY